MASYLASVKMLNPFIRPSNSMSMLQRCTAISIHKTPVTLAPYWWSERVQKNSNDNRLKAVG